MKTILSLVAIAAICITASAQSYSPQSLNLPSSISAATNLATPAILDLRRQQNVTIAATITAGASGNTNTYMFCRSVDGSKYDTNNVFNFDAGSPAGLELTTVTNINVTGSGYLILTKITPKAAAPITNTVKYAVKPGAP